MLLFALPNFAIKFTKTLTSLSKVNVGSKLLGLKLLGLMMLMSFTLQAETPRIEKPTIDKFTIEKSIEKPPILNKEKLGELLFHDVNLSLHRNQSCATCHNPNFAFIDNRLDSFGNRLATSLGSDQQSIGERNAPTASYAKFSPNFEWRTHARFNSQQPDYSGFVGGQFLDGRENGLADQAGGPPLNPVEMKMPSKAAVVTRLQENSLYEDAFQRFYGELVFNNIDVAYNAMTEAIAEFEKTAQFAPFDSKYDRVLRGEDEFSFKELSGKSLFFSQQFTNCATCHQAKPNGHAQETFSNYEYHNIGVPNNPKLENQLGKKVLDKGLLNNPKVNQSQHRGKFKVPTLRNVAVTGPYMHNGVFKDLKTVVQFYDHFLVGSRHQINPETGQAWLAAETPETVALTELKDGRKLKPMQVEQLVCFLRTLTDQRYEHLIEEKGINCQ